jgi:class 3 adenylate cyclase/tetratricopeptide (TPR) repeat protein
MRCPRCGAAHIPAQKFCAECGAALSETTGPRGSGAPASYTPKHLAEKILTSKAALEGERKQVTVLFCDIADSTAFAERLGADAMHRLLNGFFDLALAEVHRYEGTINQFLGDGFMALFGAPVTHEDHARRAALAALGIQRAVRERQTDLPGAAGSLAVRIGMHTGPVVVGRIGDNLRMDYTAVGDTTNLAARLQQLAAPGTVLVSAATCRLMEPYADCEMLGKRTVKGRAEPVTVYRLVGARARGEPGRGTARPIGSPLVGRDTELATLARCLARLAAGQGGIVGLLGEAGLGKSRLMTEVSRTAAGGALLWLEGRSLSFGQTLSYWPFLEILRGWAGITEEDGETESARKLEREVHAVLPDEVADVLPYLATLLALPVPSGLEHRVRYLDGQAMGRQVFRSIRRLFERLARERPVVLVFEDLHWTDESSTQLIEHLMPLVKTGPLLLCGIGRPEIESPASRLRRLARTDYASHYTEVVLAPLAPAPSAVLLDNLLGTPTVPVRLRELILRKTEGNPFFVEEVIRALIADDVLAWDAGARQWRLARETDHLTLPDTLHGVIMARIDRLDEEVKQLLKAASIIGRSFFYRVLRAIADAGRELDRNLDELQQLELIREKRRLPELEYFFKHALVQEATYDSIVLERRRELHRRVGECIESLFAERLEDFSGVLAYHYARAEDWPKAQDYLFKAGDHAGRVAADAEALAHYQEAIRAYEHVFGDRWDPFQRAVLERKIGEALFRRGEHDQALGWLSRALARLRAPYPTSGWGVRLAICGQLLRQAGHRLLPSWLLGKASASADPLVDEVFRLHDTMGWIYYMADPERFVLGALTGLNYFERHRHPVGLVLQYMSIGIACDLIPAFWLGERYHRRALAVAASTGHPIAIGYAQHGMAIHEFSLGESQRALDRSAAAAAAFREAGHIRGLGNAWLLTAWNLQLRGDFAQAFDRAADLVRLGEESSDRQILVWGLAIRGLLRQCTGLLDDAVADLQAAMELGKSMPDYAGVAQAAGILGRCYLQRREVRRALQVLDEGNRVIAEHGLRGMSVVWTPLVLAEAHVRMLDEADGEPRDVRLKKARRACRHAVRQGEMMRFLLPMALRLRGMLEWRTGKRGAATRSWERSIAAAEQVGARYELALTSLEIGRSLGSRLDLERAATIFEEVGATPALAEARRVLTGAGGA